MKKHILLLFFFSFFLFAGNADGFDIKGLQPVAPYGVFSTFSADSLPKGKHAVAAGIEKVGEPDFFRYLLQYAYGINNKVEIMTTIPYVDRWDNVKSGYEDIGLGVKHRFIDETKYSPSVAYMVNASVPSGQEVFSTDGRLGAGLIVSKRVGPVSGHANMFYEKVGSSRLEDEVSFAAGFDFSAAHDFKILAEIYGKKSHYSDSLNSIEGRFGYRFMTTDYLYTTIGIGTDFKNRNPEYRLMLTITAVLPAEKRTVKKVYEEDK